MSDITNKAIIARLRDLGWRLGKCHDQEIVFLATDRIKELQAQIEELHYGVTAAHFQGYIQGGQAAEDKLTGNKDEFND